MIRRHSTFDQFGHAIVLPAMPDLSNKHKPLIALTLGDVAGVGPEVVVRACRDRRVRDACLPIVVGHPDVLRRAAKVVNEATHIVESDRFAVPARTRDDDLYVINAGSPDAADVPAGAVDARAGRAAYDYLVAATDAALANDIDAIVTAPLNKAALHAAGLHYPGHTEILAERCGARQFAMMLYMPPGPNVLSPYGMGVAHVTLHTSIRSVPELLSTDGIREKIELVDTFLKKVGCPQPRIGVCALNPHGGEQGLFGDEESTLIAPAVEQARSAGINADGPHPADTLLKRATAGEFDGVVAMYHDQGHIALKLLGFHRAVNVTLGLPIVRTSPSHGTAFDIAWRGEARPDGMIEAILLAAKLAAEK